MSTAKVGTRVCAKGVEVGLFNRLDNAPNTEGWGRDTTPGQPIGTVVEVLRPTSGPLAGQTLYALNTPERPGKWYGIGMQLVPCTTPNVNRAPTVDPNAKIALREDARLVDMTSKDMTASLTYHAAVGMLYSKAAAPSAGHVNQNWRQQQLTALGNTNAKRIQRQNIFANGLNNGQANGIYMLQQSAGIGSVAVIENAARMANARFGVQSQAPTTLTLNGVASVAKTDAVMWDELERDMQLGVIPIIVGWVIVALAGAAIGGIIVNQLTGGGVASADTVMNESNALYNNWSQYIPAEQRQAFMQDVQTRIRDTYEEGYNQGDADDSWFDNIKTPVLILGGAFVGGKLLKLF